MRSPTAFPFIMIVTVFAVCRPAAADDRETCKNSSGEVAIDACSSAIKSKKFKGSTLSLLYTNRGVEYVVKEDIDRGIADHDQAIKLDPKNSPSTTVATHMAPSASSIALSPTTTRL